MQMKQVIRGGRWRFHTGLRQVKRRRESRPCGTSQCRKSDCTAAQEAEVDERAGAMWRLVRRGTHVHLHTGAGTHDRGARAAFEKRQEAGKKAGTRRIAVYVGGMQMKGRHLASRWRIKLTAVLLEPVHEVKLTVPLAMRKPPPCMNTCEEAWKVSGRERLNHVTGPREIPLRKSNGAVAHEAQADERSGVMLTRRRGAQSH